MRLTSRCTLLTASSVAPSNFRTNEPRTGSNSPTDPLLPQSHPVPVPPLPSLPGPLQLTPTHHSSREAERLGDGLESQVGDSRSIDALSMVFDLRPSLDLSGLNLDDSGASDFSAQRPVCPPSSAVTGSSEQTSTRRSNGTLQSGSPPSRITTSRVTSMTSETRTSPATSHSQRSSTARSGDSRAEDRHNQPIQPSSIIAFNARDAITNAYLIDPVLGSDGLSQSDPSDDISSPPSTDPFLLSADTVHDRWSIIEGQDELSTVVKM